MTTPLLANANACRIPLADESVDVCVTSPPYWSLRKYAGQQERIWGGDPDCRHEWGERHEGDTRPYGAGLGKWQHGEAKAEGGRPHIKVDQGRYCSKCSAWHGSLGLEPDPDLFVSHLVEVFQEVRRVLKPTGTVWANMGDGYAGAGYSNHAISGPAQRKDGGKQKHTPLSLGLKPKDLCLIPARLSLALQADGWWIRSQIIWHKPNCMPESCSDRPTTSHEYILLLTKRARYYYDADAVRENHVTPAHLRTDRPETSRYKVGTDDNGSAVEVGGSGFTRHRHNPAGRNRRTVWTIPTQSFRGAHFATFSTALPDICIRAGSSEHGVCPECGKPWERVVKRKTATPGQRPGYTRDCTMRNDGERAGSWTDMQSTTTGWRPTCTCQTYASGVNGPSDVGELEGVPFEPVPAVVLDPFCGSGSTMIAARRLGRQGIGLDLSFPYLRDQARPRLELDRLADWGQGREAETELAGLPLFEMRGEEDESSKGSGRSTPGAPTR